MYVRMEAWLNNTNLLYQEYMQCDAPPDDYTIQARPYPHEASDTYCIPFKDGLFVQSPDEFVTVIFTTQRSTADREYVDRSATADAARFRWLLNGNGYFMEEEGLCGHDPSDEEQDECRVAIDKAMAEDS